MKAKATGKPEVKVTGKPQGKVTGKPKVTAKDCIDEQVGVKRKRK